MNSVPHVKVEKNPIKLAAGSTLQPLKTISILMCPALSPALASSLGGNKYDVHILELYTWKFYVIMIESRSELPLIISDYKAMAKTLFSAAKGKSR